MDWFEKAISSFWLSVPALPDIVGVGWLSLTIITYLGVVWLRERYGAHPLTTPVLLASLTLGVILIVLEIDFADYSQGGDILAWLILPATVAMAIPLYDHFSLLRKYFVAIFSGIVVGSISSVGTALAIGWVFGLSPDVLASLATRSVTTPIAIHLAYEMGGIGALAAAIVVITGVFGIVTAPYVFRFTRIPDERAQGLAYGLAATAIGTSDALRQSRLMGSFAAVSLGVNGILTGFLLPLLFQLT